MSVLSAIRLSASPATAFVVIGIFWGAFAAYLPQIKAQIGAGDAVFGMLLLGTAFGLLPTMFLAPVLDRWLGPRAMPLAAGLFALAFLAPGLAVTPFGFFLAMVGAGFASGLTDVIMNARVSEIEAASGRSLMNANHGMFSLAYAISAVAAGLAREGGLPPVAVFAGLGLVTLGLTTQMRAEAVSSGAIEDGAGRFPYRPVLLCGAIVLIAFMAEAAVEAWSALHVERTLGGRAAEGAMGPAMLGLTMAIGRFSGQAVVERFSDFTVIFWATLLAILGALLSAIAPVPLVAYLGFGVLGLGVSVIGPLGLAIVGRLVRSEMRVKAIARTAVIGFMGFFVAPTVMGVTSELFGLRMAFVVIALLLVAIFPFMAALRR